MRYSKRINVLYAPVHKDAGIRSVNLISGRRADGQHWSAWDPELEARREMTQSFTDAGGNRHLFHSKGYLCVDGYR
jgi:hypothetical protein